MTQIGLYTTNPLAYTPPYGLPLTSYRPLMDSQTVSYTKRVPNCQKCGQHGRKSRLKGHKRVCPYRDCNCAKVSSAIDLRPILKILLDEF
ncbi:Doublesex- and mab-3-related transcription factor 1 [Toxocara canis]|uniref:Doublesex-and mab-3-related transcription factor 1 n=1 Tax=Toxocara canis TaxID=6265 RepID=A0A0B2VXH6_TOXCA|nr:Doublesex- and mab-3-related transcription factor 1 [Toxocara canis]